jgi:hypothetical protein
VRHRAPALTLPFALLILIAGAPISPAWSQPVPRPPLEARVLEKAAQVNAADVYGCFEEIGAEPRTAALFFGAGHASGTILATHSHYGKGASNEVYGVASRFVSEERLRLILDRLFPEALRFGHAAGQELPSRVRYFAFANTVATNRNGPGHGWVGLRYRPRPDSDYSDRTGKTGHADVLMHVRLHSGPVGNQAEDLGSLGVNLVHAAFLEGTSVCAVLESLRTAINDGSKRVVEIDHLVVSDGVRPEAAIGPALLAHDWTDRVLIVHDATGVHTAELATWLHGKVPLIFRPGDEPAEPIWRRLAPRLELLGLAPADGRRRGVVPLEAVPFQAAAQSPHERGPGCDGSEGMRLRGLATGASRLLVRSWHPSTLAREVGVLGRDGCFVLIGPAELGALVDQLDPQMHGPETLPPPNTRFLLLVPGTEPARVDPAELGVIGASEERLRRLVNEGRLVLASRDTGTIAVAEADLVRVLPRLAGLPDEKVPTFQAALDRAQQDVLAPTVRAALDGAVARRHVSLIVP